MLTAILLAIYDLIMGYIYTYIQNIIAYNCIYFCAYQPSMKIAYRNINFNMTFLKLVLLTSESSFSVQLSLNIIWLMTAP